MAEESDRSGARTVAAPSPQELLTCAYEVLAMVTRDCVSGLKTAVAEAKGDPLMVLGRTVRVIGALARSVRLVAELSLKPPKRRGREDTDMNEENGEGGNDAERLERMRIEIQHNFAALRRVYERKRVDAGLEPEGASASFGRQPEGAA